MNWPIRIVIRVKREKNKFPIFWNHWEEIFFCFSFRIRVFQIRRKLDKKRIRNSESPYFLRPVWNLVISPSRKNRKSNFTGTWNFICDLKADGSGAKLQIGVNNDLARSGCIGRRNNSDEKTSLFHMLSHFSVW